MDERNRKLLNIIQRDFPLVSRPYAEVGRRLGLPEEEVIERLGRLSREGILRQIGGIFNPPALGYRTSLVAFEVPEDLCARAAGIINAHPGVSHNYLRDHRFNFWFTIAVPPGTSLEDEVQGLARGAGAVRLLLLPIKRVFRIAVIFDLEEGTAGNGSFETVREILPPDAETVRLVRAVQEPLPLVPRPFREVAERVGLSEEELLSWIREMLARGVMRRFAGLVRHRRAGFRENVMVAWRVPEEKIVKVGEALAREPGVTHCYERVSYPDWPYNLYTMIHARQGLKDRVRRLAETHGIPEYLALRTLKEYKKVRLKLFVS
ncbi:AsnC family transcriptional regulator [Thermosulfurimonas sp. F29]|uniref:siroheme decarboxylase subunit alpha n=1 Tax=Thermosulfurimonas sp. F29 TaxID=2867247 RepID=UPI001C82A12D|nr:AsnC family transcriptional regulator [Thermosulfurimonas sp. F29]MBX6422551.1 AsnC family transcriptional regulator [Thermosulfurimonas sp. F29]